MVEQVIVFATIAMALALFAWGRIRYDAVALLALLVVTLTGVVPAERAFLGFGHPAVITVAAVLVISRCLISAGLIDIITRLLAGVGETRSRQIPTLTGVVTAISSLMNNIGSLAMLMPVALRLARQSRYSPSLILMPLAFGSLLGGLVTMIGTPPNILIATYRAQLWGEPFGMFDFTPVGLGVALAGFAFIALIGWRLVPERRGQLSREALFEIKAYTTELRVPKTSPLVGLHLRDLHLTPDVDVTIAGLVRAGRFRPVFSSLEVLREGDVLVVEADPHALKGFVDETRLELAGSKKLGEEALGSDEVSLAEAVVTPNSRMVGRTVKEVNLRRRYGINLLAVARHGQRLKRRLDKVRFQAGDVLLLQGMSGSMPETLRTLDVLPLAERELRLGQPRKVALGLTLFGAAIAASAAGVLPVQVAFVAAALAMVLTGLLSPRQAYEGIDWSIIVLLGAFIPVGEALETTGGAHLLASGLLYLAGEMAISGALALLLAATMLLSNIINNAAAALLMAPIGVGMAAGLEVSSDAFLMAVAIGASCAFLTPIGHQSNTLVLGPGGYRFADYWRLGLPLSLLVALVAVPLLMLVWTPHG